MIVYPLLNGPQCYYWHRPLHSADKQENVDGKHTILSEEDEDSNTSNREVAEEEEKASDG